MQTQCCVSTIRAASTWDMKCNSYTSCVADCPWTVQIPTSEDARIAALEQELWRRSHVFAQESWLPNITACRMHLCFPSSRPVHLLYLLLLVLHDWVWSSDTLHHLMMKCVSKTNDLQTCCIAFATYLLTKNHSKDRLVHEFHTMLYVCVSFISRIDLWCLEETCSHTGLIFYLEI
jgi:hypothetical protein